MSDQAKKCKEQFFQDLTLFLEESKLKKDSSCLERANELKSLSEMLSLEEIEPLLDALIDGIKEGNKETVSSSFAKLKETLPQANKEKEEPSLKESFLFEVRTNGKILAETLIRFEREPERADLLNDLIRAAHSIVGAAKLFSHDLLSMLAKRLEDVFKRCKKGQLNLNETDFKTLEQALYPLETLPAKEDLNELSILQKERFFEAIDLLKPYVSEEASEPDESSLMKNDAMLALFKEELSVQSQNLEQGLLEALQGGEKGLLLEKLMRSAHSIKGAAKVVQLNRVVRLSHLTEEVFYTLQKEELTLSCELADVLLEAIDCFKSLAKVSIDKIPSEEKLQGEAIEAVCNQLELACKREKIKPSEKKSFGKIIEGQARKEPTLEHERMVRVSAKNINRLMGLAGESLVQSRHLPSFCEAHLQLKKILSTVLERIDDLRLELIDLNLDEKKQHLLEDLGKKASLFRQRFSDQITQLEMYSLRNSNLSDRLYREAVNSRMRPFSEGVTSFHRMAYDLSRHLHKEVKLEIKGLNTSVDREILEKLEAPLSHLIRNAIDHGIETKEERLRFKKNSVGLITIEAEHKAGMLHIAICDDGRGLDSEKIKKTALERGLISQEEADQIGPAQIHELLFKPGFSTRDEVTDISGRGVGLDVVSSMVKEVGGYVRVHSILGQGCAFMMKLPLTLSVISALIVEVNKEPYAFPLSRIDRALTIDEKDIIQLEDRQFFTMDHKNIGLLHASSILGLPKLPHEGTKRHIVLISSQSNRYGLIVDAFLEDRELVVQEIDSRLGKIQDISAGAFMEDGQPLFIFDVEDLVASIDLLLSKGYREGRIPLEGRKKESKRKKILVVDDSVTVREVENRLLKGAGYEVDLAVNGLDGWNAARLSAYDLIITDVDMPRMSGLELLSLIKSDASLKETPVMIVSYKERPGDRQAGLDLGASYYLTKSSFHDNTLLEIVKKLIGPPLSKD